MFPPAIITHLTTRLSACLTGVMLALGDRVRPLPSFMTPRSLLPERLVFHTQQWLMRRRSMILGLMDRIAAGKCRSRPYKAREPKPGAVRKPRAEIPSEQWLPRMSAWIRRMAPEMVRAVEDLTRLLEEPEMKAMVLAAPQMARAWVPLLNAVGEAKPEWWPKPPPRRRKPRASGPLAQKPAASEKLDPVEAWRARQPPPPPPPLQWWEILWPPDHPRWQKRGPYPDSASDPIGTLTPLGFRTPPSSRFPAASRATGRVRRTASISLRYQNEYRTAGKPRRAIRPSRPARIPAPPAWSARRSRR